MRILPAAIATDALAGMQFPAGIGLTTVLPEFDYETYSEAGYVFNKTIQKWESLPGLSDQNRGLKAVGVRNYVSHPSFRLLSLSWNLKDGKGKQRWRPDPYLYEDGRTPAYYPRLPEGIHADDCALGIGGGCDCAAQYHPIELIEYVANGGIIEAWNIAFEWQVWNFYCVPVLGWPPLPQEQCRDAMAKSRASAYPGGLDDAGTVLKLVEQKDPEGKRLIRKLTVPKNPTKNNLALRWTPFTATEDFEKFYVYNERDIAAEAEASARLQDLSERELGIWLMHLRINMRGMGVNAEAVEDCILIIEQAELKYNSRLSEITNGAVKGSSEVTKILEWMRRQGVNLFNLDEEAIEEALTHKDYPRGVLEVLRIRQMMAFGSVKKYYSFRAKACNGRLYDQYDYYGTHTGLWNGREVQPANLYKGAFSRPEQVERALAIIRCRCLELVELEYGENSPWHLEQNEPMDALEVVASCLRSMITAAPGYRFISADFSAIQAVATSCMANEQWRIDVFRTHGKIYEAMASMLTGKPFQFYIDYKAREKKHHPDRQDYGKIPVLSADFGAWIEGWKKFGAGKLGDDRRIKELILLTRSRIPNVVFNLWGGQTINKFKYDERQLLHGLEGAAISAILEPGTCFNSRPDSRLGVLFQMHEDTLYCRPPSGGFIRYHAPRLCKSSRDYASPWEYEISYEGNNTNQNKGKIGWIRMSVYGGVFTQNVISNMCREIQADALKRLEDRGYPVVMHTHDENVTEKRIGEGSIEEYMQIVRELPTWAICDDGLPWPVKVPDAWEAGFYGKWEFD